MNSVFVREITPGLSELPRAWDLTTTEGASGANQTGKLRGVPKRLAGDVFPENGSNVLKIY